MSDLRKQLIRLAHENPGEVRDAVLPLLCSRTAGRPESPLEKAVWNAWDYMEGTEKFKEGFLDKAEEAATDALVSEEAYNDQRIERLGDKISKAKGRVDRQSRSWRTALNLSLKGKITLDEQRLAKDLGKTLNGIRLLEKDLRRLGGLVSGFTQDRVAEALKWATPTVRAFQDAIKLAS